MYFKFGCSNLVWCLHLWVSSLRHSAVMLLLLLHIRLHNWLSIGSRMHVLHVLVHHTWSVHLISHLHRLLLPWLHHHWLLPWLHHHLLLLWIVVLLLSTRHGSIVHLLDSAFWRPLVVVVIVDDIGIVHVCPLV